MAKRRQFLTRSEVSKKLDRLTRTTVINPYYYLHAKPSLEPSHVFDTRVIMLARRA
jgi:hypothetical protein